MLRVGTAQLIVRTYTRAFLSQGVGIIGLLWCLYDRHPWLGSLLTVLLLVDQAIFLHARFSPAAAGFPFRTALNLWCLFVSLFDVLVLYALFYEAAGLREAGNVAITAPADFLAFSIAVFVHGPTDIVPASGAARLLAAGESFLSAAAFVSAAVIFLLTWARPPGHVLPLLPRPEDVDRRRLGDPHPTEQQRR